MKATPLHIGILTLLITGIGLIVTVKLKGAPEHPVAVTDGTMEYILVCGDVVGFVKVPLIDAWLFPEFPPLIPPFIVGDGHV